MQLEYDFKPYHLTGIVLINQEVFQKFVLDGVSFHDVSIIYVVFKQHCNVQLNTANVGLGIKLFRFILARFYSTFQL